jgi:methionyl-tRNA formyltransferase
MRISILITDRNHPVVNDLINWEEHMRDKGHIVAIHYKVDKLIGGDILFLVSCSEIVRTSHKSLYKSVFVLHASDLPEGRGWSPHIWKILAGSNQIVLSLIEAAMPVDSGKIWLQTSFDLKGNELLPEINKLLFNEEISLMTKVVDEYFSIVPRNQEGNPGPYMRKRTPDDSELDIDASLRDQFNLLRIVDNNRYPAFFNHLGCRYVLKIEKIVHEE